VIAHWDDVAPMQRPTPGHIRGTWFDLGTAAGSVGAGARRFLLGEGEFSTPAHVEGADEELFFVLGGDALSWQDGRTYEVRAGDLVVHRAGKEAHTLYAREGGADVLVFGTRTPRGGTFLPRAGVAWIQSSWVDAGGGGHPFEREAAVGAPELPEPSPRPPTIVSVDDVAPMRVDRGESHYDSRDLGRAAGSVRTGIRHVTIDPGALGSPPHCHSAEEEIFVVLAGGGTLLLGDEERPVRHGHVVSRPPATRVAHAFRAGPGGLTLLAYGTREPNDIAYYPRSGKVYLRGVGVMARLEQLDYWDGEE
jgi:uncharacterized cupin superfamily protein